MFSEKVVGVSVISVCHVSCAPEKRSLRSHDHSTPWQIAVFASFCPRSVSPLARSYTLSWCQTLFFSALLQSFCCQPHTLGPLFSVPLSLFLVFFFATRGNWRQHCGLRGQRTARLQVAAHLLLETPRNGRKETIQEAREEEEYS